MTPRPALRPAPVSASLPALPIGLLILAACGGPAPGRPAERPLIVSDRGGAIRVFEVDRDAGVTRLVGSPRADDSSYADSMPVRLPDGRVAFVSDRGGPAAIYVTTGDPGAARPLFSGQVPGTADSDPAPLGSERILFARAEAGASGSSTPPARRRLFVAALDGSGIRALTGAGGDDGAPCAAADGRTVVFVSDRDGTPRLFRLDSGAADPGSTVSALFPVAEKLIADAAPACLADGAVLFARRIGGRPPQIFVWAPAQGGLGLRQVTDATVLPFGAGEPVSLPDRTLLLTAGPAPGADGRPLSAVYRITEGGYNLVRWTRDRVGYSDFTRRLAR